MSASGRKRSPFPSATTTHNRSFNPSIPLPNFGRLFIVANDRLATRSSTDEFVNWWEAARCFRAAIYGERTGRFRNTARIIAVHPGGDASAEVSVS